MLSSLNSCIGKAACRDVHATSTKGSAAKAVSRNVRCRAAVVTLERPAVDVDSAVISSLALARVQELIEQARNQPTAQVTFRMKAKLGMGDSIKVVGDAAEMGRWVPEVAYPAKWNPGDVWDITLPVRLGTYKYKVVVRKAYGAYIYEAGEDRWLELNEENVFQPVTVELEPKLPAKK